MSEQQSEEEFREVAILRAGKIHRRGNVFWVRVEVLNVDREKVDEFAFESRVDAGEDDAGEDPLLDLQLGK